MYIQTMIILTVLGIPADMWSMLTCISIEITELYHEHFKNQAIVANQAACKPAINDKYELVFPRLYFLIYL